MVLKLNTPILCALQRQYDATIHMNIAQAIFYPAKLAAFAENASVGQGWEYLQNENSIRSWHIKANSSWKKEPHLFDGYLMERLLKTLTTLYDVLFLATENMMKIANSQRLRFEMMSQNDADSLFEIDQDPVVMRFINGGRASTMEEIQTILLPRLKSYTNADKGWGMWKVTTLETELDCPSAYIGLILVRPMDFFSDAPQFNDIELGWRFKQISWGKGYATEAALALKNMLTQQTEVSHVSAVANEDNLPSINIMKKLGMQFIKHADYSIPGGTVEVVYYQVAV